MSPFFHFEILKVQRSCLFDALSRYFPCNRDIWTAFINSENFGLIEKLSIIIKNFLEKNNLASLLILEHLYMHRALLQVQHSVEGVKTMLGMGKKKAVCNDKMKSN